MRRRRTGEPFAVLCLDLDRFKHVNDVYGHAAGDAVLRVSSQRISSVLGPDDLLSRLGGDEFAIIRCQDCDTAGLAKFSEEILAVVAPGVLVNGQATSVGVSHRGRRLPAGRRQPAGASMRNADAALYQAKKDGRGVHRFFSAAIGAERREREMLEADLRHALERARAARRLPAADRPEDRPGVRLRGPGALGQPRPRRGAARRVRARRRGKRPDPRHRRVGAARGLQDRRRLVQAAAGGGQPVRRPAALARAVQPGPPGAAGDRTEAPNGSSSR